MKKVLLSLMVLVLLVGCQQAKETVEVSNDSVEIENTSESYYKMIKIDSNDSKRAKWTYFQKTIMK